MRVWLCLSLGVVAVSGAAGPAPLVMWSPKSDSFVGHPGAREHVEPALNDAGDLVEWMHRPQGSGKAGESPIDALVVLMGAAGEGLASELEAYPRVHEQIRNAGSSMVVPAVPRGPFHDHLSARVPEEHHLVAHPGMEMPPRAGNGAPGPHNVLMMQVPEEHQTDSGVAQILERVSEATDGNYAVAMMMKPVADFTEKHTALLADKGTAAHRPARRLSTSSSDNKQYVRMTPDILAGLLTGILLLVIALIGFSCLTAIQTPSKFSDVPPPSTKEY